jgi:outer membrane biosynthesis protein TonB
MRRALIYSLALHVAVIVLGTIGGVFWRADLPPMETAVVVEVVPLSDKTNVPVRKKQETAAKSPSEQRPAATPDETPALKRAPPKPKVVQPPAEPPQQTASVAAPKAEPAPKPISAEPAPKPKVQEPAPEPAPASPDQQPSLDAAKPKRKPEPDKAPPSSFESVLKTVEALKQQSPSKDTVEKPKDDEPGDPSEQAASDAVSPSRSRDYQASEPVSMSEIDRVRRQIERCWNLPAGARGAENMVVSVRVEMNIDGTPGAAAVIEQERMGGDPPFRAAAESALRAVLNPRCHPFGLPREKYESWKTMTLVFDPKEMFGT